MTKIAHILKIKYPLIQAPMALADSPALAAAISNAGGLGSLGAALFSPEQIRAKIKEIRQLTDKPFAVNLFAPTMTDDYSTSEIKAAIITLNEFREKLGLAALDHLTIQPSASFEEKLAVILEERVPVFSFTFGVLSSSLIAQIKSHDIAIIGTATTVREAQLLEKNGVDMVVAQGYEAGGHRGTDLTLTQIDDALIGSMAFIPQVVNAVKIPVVASGGIMDGRGIIAAFNLGAQGVQMGTAFLCCPESNIHAVHRKKLLTSSDESTRLTNVFTGRMARSIKNKFFHDMIENHRPILGYPLQSAIVKDIKEAAQQQNNPEYMSLWAGQASSLCQEKPAAQLFHQLILEAKALLKKEKNVFD